MSERERELWLLRSNIDRFRTLLKTETDEAQYVGECIRATPLDGKYIFGSLKCRHVNPIMF